MVWESRVRRKKTLLELLTLKMAYFASSTFIWEDLPSAAVVQFSSCATAMRGRWIFEHHVSHISSRNDIREFDIIKMVRDFDVGENVQKLCMLSELFWKNLSFLKTQFCTPRNQAALDQLSPVFALSFVSICALKLKGVICKSNDPGSSPAKIIALLYYQSQVNKGQISLKLYKVSCLSNWIQRCRGLN